MSRPYRAFVSLGTGCATAHHIRRLLWPAESHFFDWLVTPLPALLTLLRTDLRSLFRDPDEFRPQEAPHSDYFPARHERLGVISYHDMRREEGFRDFPSAAQKYRFLADRWDATMATGGPVLFVRHIIDNDDCLGLVNGLKEIYPDLEFSLLAVNEGLEPCEPWNIAGVWNTIIRPTPFEAIGKGLAGPLAWQGDAEGWFEAFKLVGVIE
jgi:hypothetical protein